MTQGPFWTHYNKSISHINVKSIASVKVVKYIYKYVYKGHDYITIKFGTAQNEIKLYLNVHCVSSYKACLHLYYFDI